MKNKNRLTPAAKLLLMLLLSIIVLGMLPPATLQAQTSSAVTSQPSATPVDSDAALRASCKAALDELVAARTLIEAQGKQISNLEELVLLEKQLTDGLKSLRDLDAQEKQSLRNAIDAANREAAALKDEIAILKKEKMTLWKKVKYVLIGVGIGAAVIALKN